MSTKSLSAPNRSSAWQTARELVIERPYLVLPIKQTNPQHWVRIEIDGATEREFEASWYFEGDEMSSADFNAHIDLAPWVGKKMKIIVEKPTKTPNTPS